MTPFAFGVEIREITIDLGGKKEEKDGLFGWKYVWIIGEWEKVENIMSTLT